MRANGMILSLAALLVAVPCSSPHGQSFPSRPIRFITVAAPGTDIITRIMAHEMTNTVGQQVVVENRTGGSGLVGARAAR